MSKKTIIVSVILTICLIVEAFVVFRFNKDEELSIKTISVNLTDLTYKIDEEDIDLKIYTQDDFDAFLNDYELNQLPDVYVTDFIFDGVGMYKTYDLDDFIDNGNDTSVDVFSIKAFNVNTTGNVEFSGDIVGGMILVNSNGIDGDINIILNGVNIDTDSKKAPAIYVYNRNMNYTDHKVTISTKEGTKNYIDGGKLKKVSLIGSDELNNYSSKYSSSVSSWYSEYTNYYGVYTKSQVDSVLFAKVIADSEDLADGDPYYFYKASGAISSDIDLDFNGSGYLEVTSKNKEGIETKGNLTFSGGIGDYVINAMDDCLNTTTKSSNNSEVRNNLIIDVNSLAAIVSMDDADEGDAIDSNGTLTINGGTIIALAHPGQDGGLDSDGGTCINGGTVIATGDMYDEISSDSKQNFIGLSFNGSFVLDDIITLVDSNNSVIFSYKSDRNYSNLVYSSSKLVNGNYSLYKNGSVVGNDFYGFYDSVDNFSDGIALGYTNTGMRMSGGMGNFNGDNMPSDMSDMDDQNRPDMGDFPNSLDDNSDRPERPDDMGGGSFEMPNGDDNEMVPFDSTNYSTTSNPFAGLESANKVFSISGISNLFSGIVTYSEE